MNTQEPSSLPPALRARLDQEPPDERDELERVWHLLGESAPPAAEPPDPDAEWAALQQELDAPATSSSKRERTPSDRPAASRSTRQVAWRRWAGAAALLLIVGLVGLLFWQRPVHLSTPPGEQRIATLPDGSTVELNSGTTLSYQRGFGALPLLSSEERTVTLEGEAFFDIQEDERPFVVETFNARVRVLGTQFNVQAWPEATTPETAVTLATGQVQVAARHAPEVQETVTLSEGQSSRVVGSQQPPTSPQTTSVERVLAWRQQGFSVSDEPLAAIFDKLERRYGVHITLQASSAATDSMTLFYPQHTGVETILHDICVAQNLKFRATSRGYEVYREPDKADVRP